VNSRIYHGRVFHARMRPVEHRFGYPVFTLGIDLDELNDLDKRCVLFGVNRWNLLSVHERDYLRGAGTGRLKERVVEVLKSHGGAEAPARVVLVTGPRILGYVFNPVSFFYCYDPDGDLIGAIAEVNNTFGETHLYVLTSPNPQQNSRFHTRYTVPKEFHVSPFNDRRGDYDFLFGELGERLDIRVNILRDRQVAFLAGITGRGEHFGDSAILRTAFRFPSSVVLNMPRILWQAAKLYYGKGLAVYTKPTPSSAMTIRTSPPALMERIGLRFAKKHFAAMKRGRLILQLPDGETLQFGRTGKGPTGTIKLRSYEFFAKILKEGDIGFGRSYIDGDWETPDLLGLFDVFIANYSLAEKRSSIASTIGTWAHRAWHRSKSNSVKGSRANIAYHYDLGNDFYRTFLDDSMMYSAGIHNPADVSPEQAQFRKIERLIEKADLNSSHHLLEIGSGWGTFAIEAARRTGCRVTTITLSREQLKWAREAVVKAGLQDKVEVRFQDYRQVKGKFDRIVSIEMLEAVGHENLGTYFGACDRLLKPGGRAVIQVITMPDQRYDNYLREGDFIQRFIFPGAVCPSLSAMNDAMKKNSRLVVDDLENIGPHYAETLHGWREAFHLNISEVRKLGFDDRFVRMWDYYLAYCEAGFRRRMISDLQLVLTRSGEGAPSQQSSRGR